MGEGGGKEGGGGRVVFFFIVCFFCLSGGEDGGLAPSAGPGAAAAAADADGGGELGGGGLPFRQAYVAADQVGFHGGRLLGQLLGRVGRLGLVLAVVHRNGADEARAESEALVKGVSPAAAATETCRWAVSKPICGGWWGICLPER